MKFSDLPVEALAAALPDDIVQTDLGGGIILDQHPCGVRKYVLIVVRPFRSIREQFLMPMRMMKSAGKDESAVIGSVDWEGQAERALEEKIESDVAFVACTLCRPTSPQDPEYKKWVGWLTALPDDKFEKALKGAQDVSFGGDVRSFFGEVSKAVNGFDIMNMSAPQSAQAA